jgi:hypothetical protein
VEYQPKNVTYSPTGVAGPANLIGYDLGGSEALVATDTTGPSGTFSLTTDDDFTRHRLELAELPQGYIPAEAEAPSPGTVIDPRTIDYGTAGPGTYPDNTFTQGDPTPSNINASYGPVYLIVASLDVIDAGALDAFRTFKIQQGYAISIRSVEEIDAGYPGASRLERIRALEQEYLQTYGDRFQFVLLVGNDSVIPFARVTPWATGEEEVCPTEDPKNYKFTDWLYVDLESPVDSNGNGCIMDGLLTASDKLADGYTPDSGFQFKPAIVLGRIPFNDPNTIRQVLKNSTGFESQTESYKLRALMGMSMIQLKGYYEGQPCGQEQWGDRCVAPVPNDQTNYDSSLLSEEMQDDFLDVNGFQTTYLYENEAAVAGGQGIISPLDLTRDNIRDTLSDSRFGVAVMSGHGSSGGVYRNWWDDDANDNGVVDVYVDDTEIAGGTFFDISHVLDDIGSNGSRGSIFVLLACNNASPTNPDNLAATILSGGHGPASVAALGVVLVGSWFDEDDKNVATIGYEINERLLSRSYRLGEAVWWTLADLNHENRAGSGGVQYDLYGDPSLNFFGNPGGQSTLAAWPMGRRDPAGASYLTLPGPSVPEELWSYTAGPHGLDPFGPTPLVSNNGEVIVASGQYVDVLRQGQLPAPSSWMAACWQPGALRRWHDLRHGSGRPSVRLPLQAHELGWLYLYSPGALPPLGGGPGRKPPGQPDRRLGWLHHRRHRRAACLRPDLVAGAPGWDDLRRLGAGRQTQVLRFHLGRPHDLRRRGGRRQRLPVPPDPVLRFLGLPGRVSCHLNGYAGGGYAFQRRPPAGLRLDLHRRRGGHGVQD